MFNQALKRRLYFAVHDSVKVFFLIGKFIISHPISKVSKLPIQKSSGVRVYLLLKINKKQRIFMYRKSVW
jgi:hypothetical protein